ncbi:MAG: type II toxin-antitoxin system PemK/MazF family toxin [Candidatus Nanopelagicales bacterium]
MGSIRVRIGSVWAAARGRYYPHGTRRRRTYREAALGLFGLALLVPLLAAGWVLLTSPGVGRALVVVIGAVLLAFGSVVVFAQLDRVQPGRAPWWKVLVAWILSAPGAVAGVVLLVVDLLRGSGGGRLQTGTVLWAEMPNDEDHGATSKVRPVVVVADEGSDVLVRWFTSQDKSERHGYVEFTVAMQKQAGLDGVGHSTWLSGEARALPRSAFREPVGQVPAELLRRRPS